MKSPMKFADMNKKGKRVSSSMAKRLAEMLKGKKTPPKMDAEDKIDGGSDEDKE